MLITVVTDTVFSVIQNRSQNLAQHSGLKWLIYTSPTIVVLHKPRETSMTFVTECLCAYLGLKSEIWDARDFWLCPQKVTFRVQSENFGWQEKSS